MVNGYTWKERKRINIDPYFKEQILQQSRWLYLEREQISEHSECNRQLWWFIRNDIVYPLLLGSQNYPSTQPLQIPGPDQQTVQDGIDRLSSNYRTKPSQ